MAGNGLAPYCTRHSGKPAALKSLIIGSERISSMRASNFVLPTVTSNRLLPTSTGMAFEVEPPEKGDSRMGNYGSRPEANASSSVASEERADSKIKCYYEILCIDQGASQDEIKKAYRQQALQHHPDKNQHRIAEATAYFAQLQKAYEVLSDPQERAWYDRHRDSILGRGKARQKRQAGGKNFPFVDGLNFILTHRSAKFG